MNLTAKSSLGVFPFSFSRFRDRTESLATWTSHIKQEDPLEFKHITKAEKRNRLGFPSSGSEAGEELNLKISVSRRL